MPDANGPIVMTGAAGRLAAILRPALAAHGHAVRLSDTRRVRPLLPSETFVVGRLESPRHMRRAMQGGSALIHLGAYSTEGSWDTLIASNVAGLACCFEAARAAGIARIIFASSMHVLGMYPRTRAIDEDSPPAPDSRYAATKVFGEAHARLLAEKYGLTATVLRIGHVVEHIADAAPGQGISAGDLTTLLMCALGFADGRYRLLHAVAPHAGYPLSNGSSCHETGWICQEPGPDAATIHHLLANEGTATDAERYFHGGYFAKRID